MTLRQELRAVRKEMLRVLDRVDHLLSVAEGDDQAEQAPTVLPPPLALVPPPEPKAPPSTPTATPAPQTFPVVTGVATTWLDKRDDEVGETAKQPAYPWAPSNHTGVGLEVVGIALPFKVSEGDGADIQLPGGAWWYLPCIEKGPHHADDRYLPEGRAARAVSEPGNHAIVDITPAAQALLDGGTAAEDYAHAPMRTVNIRWHPGGGKVAYRLGTGSADIGTATQRVTEVLTRARSLIDKPIAYELGKQPPGPASDCSGFVDWCNSIDRAKTGLNTDAMVADATGPQRYYRKVDAPAPGDDYVYPSPGAGHYGHTGVISAVDLTGVPVRVIHCSSGNPEGRAVQETDPGVFTSHGAIVVRAVGTPT